MTLDQDDIDAIVAALATQLRTIDRMATLMYPTGYQLYDAFNTPLAAGAVNGTSAAPGPGTRTVTDTEGKLSITQDGTLGAWALTDGALTRTRTVVGMASANLDTQLATLPTDADVQTAAAAALTSYDPPTKAELDSAVSPLATAANLATVDTVVDSILDDTGTTIPATIAALPASITDAVWDETAADHQASGSTGHRLSSAATAGDPWSTDLPGNYADYQAGRQITDLWAVLVGDAEADDAQNPTQVEYSDLDGTTQVTHALTEKTRTRS